MISQLSEAHNQGFHTLQLVSPLKLQRLQGDRQSSWEFIFNKINASPSALHVSREKARHSSYRCVSCVIYTLTASHCCFLAVNLRNESSSDWSAIKVLNRFARGDLNFSAHLDCAAVTIVLS